MSLKAPPAPHPLHSWFPFWFCLLASLPCICLSSSVLVRVFLYGRIIFMCVRISICICVCIGRSYIWGYAHSRIFFTKRWVLHLCTRNVSMGGGFYVRATFKSEDLDCIRCALSTSWSRWVGSLRAGDWWQWRSPVQPEGGVPSTVPFDCCFQMHDENKRFRVYLRLGLK